MNKPTWELAEGDCTKVLAEMVGYGLQVDAVVTDPPYHLTAGKKGGSGEASVNLNSPYGRSRITTGFMGKKWDGGDVAFRVETWQAVWQAMKPGAHLLAFGGTRTFHRMVSAIEDAGFEVRDSICWLFGTGFPKSHDVSKAIDKAAGAEREIIEQRRVKGGGTEHINRKNAATHEYRPDGYQKGENVLDVTAPATDEAKRWAGFGTALKPAMELICVARKPLIGTVAENVLAHGTGALNIDGCRIGYENTTNPATNPLYRVQNGYKIAVGSDSGTSSFSIKPHGGEITANALGRWPANVILSVPEDEYEFRGDVTPEEKSEAYRWLSANP